MHFIYSETENFVCMQICSDDPPQLNHSWYAVFALLPAVLGK